MEYMNYDFPVTPYLDYISVGIVVFVDLFVKKDLTYCLGMCHAPC